jgi:hypothetical protein
VLVGEPIAAAGARRGLAEGLPVGLERGREAMLDPGRVGVIDDPVAVVLAAPGVRVDPDLVARRSQPLELVGVVLERPARVAVDLGDLRIGADEPADHGWPLGDRGDPVAELADPLEQELEAAPGGTGGIDRPLVGLDVDANDQGQG